MTPMLKRLVDNWVYGGFLAGLLLLALLPLFLADQPLGLVLVTLLLPLYMLHQYEEHDDDRFARFINATIGKGRTLLSKEAVFVINIFAVWAVYAAAIWLAARVNIGFGLIAVYTTLLNAVVHVAHAITLRRYAPGLATALTLFLPFGAWALWTLSNAPGVGIMHHAVGFGAAVLGHVGIIAYAVLRPTVAS